MDIDTFQPPLTMDDIWIPSNLITKLLEDLTKFFITIDEPPLVFRSHFRMLRSKRPTKPTISPNNPYMLFFTPEPDLELLGDQFVTDIRALHAKRGEALIFPSDIDAEVTAIQNRVQHALTEYAQRIKDEIKGRGIHVVESVFQYVERTNPLRITDSVTLDFDEQLIVELVDQRIKEALQELEQEQENEMVHDNGKQVLADTTPPSSPMRIEPVREVGNTSGDIPQAIMERFDVQDAKIASLAEDSQAQKAPLNQILSVLVDIQKNQNQ
jgi:hypothetical protein